MPTALRRLLLLLAVAATAACATPPTFDAVSARVPPPAAGAARIFVYRDYKPYQSLEWVPVFFNGAEIGAVGPGHVLLRDVAPGTYTIAALSQGLWPDQAKTLIVAPGQTVFAKIESFKGLDPNANRLAPLVTYVVVLKDTATGRREIGPLWYEAGRPRFGG
jgi:hypothetical protein